MTPPGMRATGTTQRTNILMAVHRLHKVTRAPSLGSFSCGNPTIKIIIRESKNEFRCDFVLSTMLEGTCRLEPHSMKERWPSARA